MNAPRNTEAHASRNHLLETLLSLQLRAKTNFCFKQYKELSERIEELQMARRREAQVPKVPQIVDECVSCQLDMLQ